MISKATLSDQIYEELKNDILSNRIAMGEKLINRNLQVRYGVSSTPIRDAINRLHRDGFVEEITKAGAKVIEFDRQYAHDINEILTIVSLCALKMSAEKSDIAEVSQFLSKNLDLQEKNINNDNYFYYDKEFHMVFFRYAHNNELYKLYESYRTRQDIIVRYVYLANAIQRNEALEQHNKIYKAYNNGDINAAYEHLKNHLESSVSNIDKGFS